MANIYRGIDFYARGKRIANGVTGTFTVMKAGEQIFNSDGWAGDSSGPVTSSLQITEDIPVQGNGLTLDETLIQGSYIDITVPVNGKIFQTTMRLTQIEYSGDHSNGKCTGVTQATGGKPEIIAG
jgi:hypothetical protein